MDDPPLLRCRLSLLMFLVYAVPGAFLPLLTRWLQDLHFTPMEMGLVCATQAVAALVSTWIAGQVADRWVSAERCLLVSSVAAGLCLWLVADQTAPLPVFLGCLGFWLVMAPALTLCSSLCFTHLRDPRRHFGPVRLWGTIGWMAANWLLAWWFTNPPWLAALWRTSQLADIFHLGAVLAFVLAAYAWTLPHTPPATQAANQLAPLLALRLLRQRAFLVYAGCTLGVTMSISFTSQVTPLLLTDLGIGLPDLAITLTLAQLSEIVMLAILPILLTRSGMRGTMRLGLAAWLLALAILTLGEPTWLVVASLLLNGLCICCYMVAGQVFVNSRARGDFRASAQSLVAFVNGLGLLLGNLLVGGVRQAVHGSFAPTFGVALALMGSLALIFFLAFPPEEQIAAVEKDLDTLAS